MLVNILNCMESIISVPKKIIENKDSVLFEWERLELGAVIIVDITSNLGVLQPLLFFF